MTGAVPFLIEPEALMPEACSPTPQHTPISTGEIIMTLERAREEIISLRRRIDWLIPRAEAYGNMEKLLGLINQHGMAGYGTPDFLYPLEEVTANLRAYQQRQDEEEKAIKAGAPSS